MRFLPDFFCVLYHLKKVLGSESGFIYWLTQKTEHISRPSGGSAFKFVIYRRKADKFFVGKISRADGY